MICCVGSDCPVVENGSSLVVQVEVVAKGHRVTSGDVALIGSSVLPASVGWAPGSPSSSVQEVEADAAVAEGQTVKTTGDCIGSAALGSSIAVGDGAGR